MIYDAQSIDRVPVQCYLSWPYHPYENHASGTLNTKIASMQMDIGLLCGRVTIDIWSIEFACLIIFLNVKHWYVVL